MSVIAISPRVYPSPLRSGHARRRSATGDTSATLTVTVDITLDAGDTLTPQATRLLELVRELVEHGDREAVAARLSGPPPTIGVEPAAGPPSAAVAPGAGRNGTLHVLAGSRRVLRDGRPIPLTRLEYDLLVFLAEHPRRVFTRLQLLSSVWGYEHAVARTVDVHVRRLRAKLGETMPVVTTVYGVGYRLADEARISVDRDA
ncbi:transcriptional regulator [Micromonospora pisi]|uniref:Transcriptional regulator n=1 Tax=Micromonospora pisi TaxID=589240 RepID=A0A495JVF6_9ACTN|nr:winged helix-turn-helix domain-containing protein [Micromonospora pisi]RKR92515.1 transcriptional regulator [Micromonospora pisi]